MKTRVVKKGNWWYGEAYTKWSIFFGLETKTGWGYP